MLLFYLFIYSHRTDINHKFYGKVYSSEEILSGRVVPPNAARVLYDTLASVFRVTETRAIGVSVGDAARPLSTVKMETLNI